MAAENQGNAGDPLEKDFSNGYHLDTNHDPDEALRKIRTTGSLSISPELFEKIYLSPQNKVAGELRKTVGNPTPVALTGFLLSLTPLSMDLMMWRGVPPSGAAGAGMYIAFGGILMLLGSIGEWILGNTFPCVVFGSFGSFWIALGITLEPSSGAVSAYPKGTLDPGFNNSYGFYLVCMGALVTIYSICALRTNLVLFLILFLLIPAFALLTAGYFHLALGNATMAVTCIKAGGAFAFVICLLGWYIFAAILLASVDFPLNLPVFDLSHIIKGASEKNKSNDSAA